MPAQFDYKQAIKDGRSEEEILNYLVERHSVAGRTFDVETAMKEGHTTTELIDHLSSFEFPEKLESNVPDWGKSHPKLWETYRTGRKVKQKFDLAIEGGGAAIGAEMGAKIGAPFGPWGVGLGAVGGGAIVFAFSKRTNELIDAKLDSLKKGGTRTKPALDQMTDALNDLKMGAIYEMAGQGIGTLVPRIAEGFTAPYSKKMTAEAEFILKEAEKRGITLTPAEVTGSKTTALAEALFEKVWGSTDLIRDMRLKKQLVPLEENLNRLLMEGATKESIDEVGGQIWNEVTDYLTHEKQLKGDLLNAVRTRVIAKMGTNNSFYQSGLSIKEISAARSILARDRKNELYQVIGDVLPEKEFPTPTLTREAKKILSARKKLPGYGLDKETVNWLKWASQEKKPIPKHLQEALENVSPDIRKSIIVDYEKEMGEKIKVTRDWTTAQEFRRTMEGLAAQEDPFRYLGQAGQTTEKGWVFSRLKRAINDDMRLAAMQSDEAMKALEAADAFYGDYARVWKHKKIKELVKVDAGRVIDIAFKPNAIEEVKILKEALGPEGFLELRQGFMNKLLGVGKQDIFDPRVLNRQMVNYGDDVLGEVFGKSTVKELKTISKEGLNLSAQKPPSNFLKSISQLDSDFVVERIIGAAESKPQSAILARNLKTIKQVVSKDTFDKLGDKLAEKLITKNQITELIKPKAFASMVDKYNERVLKKFFPYEKVEELKNLSNIARKIQKAEDVAGNPSGTGQTLISWGIFRMIMNNPVTGGVVAFTPKQLSKIYLSKFGLKWLTEGFTIPTAGKKSIEYFTKIQTIALGENARKRRKRIEDNK